MITKEQIKVGTRLKNMYQDHHCYGATGTITNIEAFSIYIKWDGKDRADGWDNVFFNVLDLYIPDDMT